MRISTILLNSTGTVHFIFECFLHFNKDVVYIQNHSSAKFYIYCISSAERLYNGQHVMNIRLEPKDVARLNTFENNKCRKCSNQFIEGDVVVRIGARPSKYYHKECFKQY